MKIFLLNVTAVIGIVGFNGVFADDQKMHMESHLYDISTSDTRVSLGVTGDMKQHQLASMREHVEAIKSIVGLMSETKFDDASKIAHDKLGSTPGNEINVRHVQ